MDKPSDCPCGSGMKYPACCGPFHCNQRWPGTAEALMRSRYSAYVEGLPGYLLKSWDPTTRPQPGLVGEDTTEWSGLEILDTVGGGESDTEGWVEFRAFFNTGAGRSFLQERSFFVRVLGRWVYREGEVREEVVPPAPVGRNVPCPCGSTKKFKRCCGGGVH